MPFYTGVFNTVDEAVSGYITDKASAVIDAISGVATTMFVIYVALSVLAMKRGLIKEPVLDFAIRIVRISFILGIALNLGLYMRFLGDFLNHAPDHMAAILVGSEDKTIGGTLDALVDACADRAYAAWTKAGVLNGDFGMYLIAAGFAVVMVAGTVYAAFLMVLSKVALSILLALGPIAVVMMMFNATQRFFEVWLSQSLNYGLMIVLTTAVITLIISILSVAVDSSAAGDAVGFWDAVRLIALAIITALVLAQVPSIAASLSSGLALSTLAFAERVSGGIYRRTWQKQAYTDRDGRTVYARPVVHRTKQVVAGTGRTARYLYRGVTGANRNTIRKG